MFHDLLYSLKDHFFGFNVFRYITFRAALASITAFLVCLIIGPALTRFLASLDAKQTIEREGFSKLYEAHKEKAKVPTMGGLLMVGAVLVSMVLWGELSNRYVMLAMGTMLALGGVGFADDYLKLRHKNSKGLRPVWKMAAQIIVGAGLGMILYHENRAWSNIGIPFLKDWYLSLGPLYPLFVILVISGASNAVNLTDGLDGLAVGCTILVALSYAVFAYVTGNMIFSQYLQIPFIPGAGELTVFCAALVGAGMGFLWFNSHPASVFMGDVGSLALGGALGAVAVFTKKEFLLPIVGGVFVLEAASVMLQVASYKMRKKRIFLMAPIHHHFQLQGVVESKVVIRFWIVSIILALFGLATLKLQ